MYQSILLGPRAAIARCLATAGAPPPLAPPPAYCGGCQPSAVSDRGTSPVLERPQRVCGSSETSPGSDALRPTWCPTHHANRNQKGTATAARPLSLCSIRCGCRSCMPCCRRLPHPLRHLLLKTAASITTCPGARPPLHHCQSLLISRSLPPPPLSDSETAQALLQLL